MAQFDEFRKPSGKFGHPLIPEFANRFVKGEIGRRDFLRTVTLLGASATAAYSFVGRVTGEGAARSAMAAQAPRKGGTLRYAMQCPEISDPAVYDWVEKSNIARHVVEFLVRTGSDNVTRPYLAESWEPSEDLKTWTFKLREGVTWSNGDEFNADDVVFNFERWLDPATGSSNLGLFGAMTEEVETGEVDDDGNPVTRQRMIEGAVEKVDSHTVRLNLRRAELAIPENLYNYPTAIVHRRFEEEGGDLARNPVGTGPYRLERFRVGEEAVLVRRDEPYWGGEVYLDRIHYVDLGEDHSALIAALASGQVDGVYNLDISTIDAVERMPDVELKEVVTATTGVTRMRVDREPFDDPRVREAIVRCCDNERLLDLAHRGRGEAAHNHHVAPIHPEHAEVPYPKPDIERAKELLREAGYENGLRVECVVGNTAGPWESAQVQAIREMLAPAGIHLDVNVVPSATYWDQWTEVPFGLTFWTHRPLGVQVLNLAYRRGVPWNETRYDNPEFEEALDDAMQYADPDERREKMARVQKILQDDHIMVQPFWRSTFNAVHKKVRNFDPHPTRYHQFQDVWIDDERE